MGLMTKIKKRASLENPDANLLRALVGSSDTTAGQSVTEKNAMEHMPVYNAVTEISGSIASMPLKIFERRDQRGKDEARNHQLWPLLTRKPNEEINAYNYRETMMAHLLLWGNHYSQIVRRNDGVIDSLWPIGPWRVKPMRIDGDVKYRINLKGINNVSDSVPDNQEKRFVDQRNMFHVPGLGFNGLVGMNPIQFARETIGLGKSMKEFGSRFFENDSTPGGFLTHPESLDEEAKKNLRRSWNQRQQGVSKSHLVAILEEGMEWQSAGIAPEDAQFLETRKFDVVETARLFNIPPHKLKNLERSTFSNIEEQNIEYVQDTLMPWLTRIESAIKTQLIPLEERDDVFAEHQVQGLLRGDAEARGQFYRDLFNIGAMSPNDIRAKENMNPVEGGDKYFVPLNMQSVDNPVKQPQQEQNSEVNVQLRDGQYRYDGQVRSAEGRRRTIFQMRSAFEPVFNRVTNKEIEEVNNLMDKTLRNGNTKAFLEGLDLLYSGEFLKFIRQNVFPAFKMLSDEIQSMAEKEIQADVNDDEIRTFLDSYTESYIRRHSARSRRQLESEVEENRSETRDNEAQIEAVEKRLDQWERDRPEDEARHETNKLGNAVSMQTFSLAGVTQLRWTAFGSNCPFCDSLHGTIVGTEENFVNEGETFRPAGAESSLNPSTGISHPPAHKGCDCIITPA